MDVRFAPEGEMPDAPEVMARKSAKRRIQLERAKSLFDAGREYSETEVNLLLMQLFQDHVFARRALIENQFLDRTANGSRYWVKDS